MRVYKLLCCECNIFLVKRLVNFAKVAICLIGDCYMINLIYSVNQFKFDMVGIIWITNPCYVVKWKMSCPESTMMQWLIYVHFREWSSSSHYRLWWILSKKLKRSKSKYIFQVHLHFCFFSIMRSMNRWPGQYFIRCQIENI